MTAQELHQGLRVRLARIPAYLRPEDPRWKEELGKTGRVSMVSVHGVALVEWDDGTNGSWLPRYLDPEGS